MTGQQLCEISLRDASKMNVMKPLLHPSFDQTSAESRVREAAACIGWEDLGRLEEILRCMEQEMVMYAWQLPALDSMQWKSLGAPIGLSAAVKQLSLMSRNDAESPSSTKSHAESPGSKSVDNSLLELGYSSGIDDVFEDRDEDESAKHSFLTLSSSPASPKNEEPSLENPVETDGDKVRNIHSQSNVELFPKGSPGKDKAAEVASKTQIIKTPSLEAGQPGVDSRQSIAARRRRHGRHTNSPDRLEEATDPKRSIAPSTVPDVANPEADARRFQSEWEEVQAVLKCLPLTDQRAILAQLIIVANGQTQTARIRLVDSLIVRMHENVAARATDELKVQLDLIVDHLRGFARLRSDQRRLFGKVLFSSLSRLHAPSNREFEENSGQPPSDQSQKANCNVHPPQKVSV